MPQPQDIQAAIPAPPPPRPRAFAPEIASRAEVNASIIDSPALCCADADPACAFALQAVTLAMPGALSQ
jgi:hypothetical protein